MEGRPVAITTSRTLPAQPTIGVVNYVPLGGDGFTAPHAAYAVSGFGQNGTATGGVAKIVLTMDPRFVSLVSYVTYSIEQAASADAEVALLLSASDGHVPQQKHQALITAVADAFTPQVAVTWAPSPVLLPGGAKSPNIVCSAVNVDANTYFLSTFIYLFNIRVREETPMGPLLWSRGSVGGSIT